MANPPPSRESGAWVMLSGYRSDDSMSETTRVPYSKWVIGAVMSLCSLSCSIVSSRLPPTTPAERTPKAAAKCGNPWNPVVDTMSVIAGATWVLAANQKEEDSRPKTYVVTDQGTILKSEGQGQS